MAVIDDILSNQYHSLRFYYGVYDSVNVNYRIGDNTTVVHDEKERYYDTWTDFHLIPAERPTVALPNHNSKFINIPGRATPINMSSYLTGHSTFGNRSGSWTFLCDNDFVIKKGGFIAFQNDIHSKLHGRIRKVVLADDPGYFYVGELSVSPIQPGESRSSITISYNLYPYKKAVISSMDMWKFDDFDFQDGVIQYMKDLTTVNNQLVIKVYGSKERISPHISCTPVSGDMNIDKRENNTWISYGKISTEAIDSPATVIPRFVIGDGITDIRISGNGKVTIDYRRGLL